MSCRYFLLFQSVLIKGPVGDNGLVAPEFQILDDSTGMKTFLIMQTLIYNGLDRPISNRNDNQGNISISHERTLAGDAVQLVADLNLLLANNALTESELSAIFSENG